MAHAGRMRPFARLGKEDCLLLLSTNQLLDRQLDRDHRVAVTAVHPYPAAELLRTLGDGARKESSPWTRLVAIVIADLQQQSSVSLTDVDGRSIGRGMPSNIGKALTNDLDHFVLHRP